jgi:hypothetical protein
MRKFVVLLVLAAALVALQRTNGSAHENAATAAAESVAVAGSAVVSSTASHTRTIIGTGVSRVIRPGITGMSRKTSASLAELDPAIRKATPYRASRARAIRTHILATDSALFRSLDEGRPIQAMKLALKSRSLVDAVRHQVAEERLR